MDTVFLLILVILFWLCHGACIQAPAYLGHLPCTSLTYVTATQATADNSVLSVGMACVGIMKKILKSEPIAMYNMCIITCTRVVSHICGCGFYVPLAYER